MEYNDISYIYGLSTMFFGMISAIAWLRGGKLYRLVALLTGTVALECIKDFVLIGHGIYAESEYWGFVTAVDMVTVPLYAFVLTELVCPGMLSVRSMIIQETPFILLPLLYLITEEPWLFYTDVVWAGVYGTWYLIWTAIRIPKYNAALKQRYSYTENVNLNWLRVILYSFYVILGIWIADCVVFHIDIESIYLCSNIVVWMFIAYFLFRHESVMDELADWTLAEAPESQDTADTLPARIEELFAVKEIFLSPDLKLSDVANEVGSNRTYVSNYFNRDAASSFYDYVNSYRVEYACALLADSDLPVKEVAMQSGFSSPSIFSRVFARYKGCTPSAYRQQAVVRKANRF